MQVGSLPWWKATINAKINHDKFKNFSYDVFLTNYCNLRCKYCCRWCNITKHSQFYKTENVISDMLHIFEHTGIKRCCFSGGEPLLHPRHYGFT